uniref:Glutathione transferase n=1 Tax=Gossypium raimondii TaxID=29730 RepID=A0A0D2T0B7_GOSRA|nr:hypothetical protein B456_008G046300 [Gossypium raimondii]
MALVLHAGKTNKNAFKALIAAEYSGVQVKMVENFEMGVSNKTPEFIKMNPLGKVPVLETPEGPVFESNAIARYVARSKVNNPICGSSLIDYGHIEQWIDFAAMEIDANIAKWLYPRLGYGVYLPPAEEAAIAALKRALGALNTHLASNTFLVGHFVTLADIIMTCNLYLGFFQIMTKSFTSEFPHVERYFWTLVNQPKIKKILGEVKQAVSLPPKLNQRLNQRRKPKRRLRNRQQRQRQLRRRRHQSPNQRILLICCLQVRWYWMTGRGFTLTQRPISERLQLKDSGTCMIPRDTHCGFVTTSTMRRIQFHLSQ